MYREMAVVASVACSSIVTNLLTYLQHFKTTSNTNAHAMSCQ